VTALLAAFLTGAAMLWLSVFGYLLALLALAGHRHWRRQPVTDLPPIVVLMATLNETDGIDAKLADLLRVDYPTDRLRLMIVDGGSTDGTVARIEAARAAGAPIDLLRAPHLGTKLEQLRYALALLDEEIVVTTDADSRLDPGCVRALVELLVSDPNTAVAGARVRPDTQLLEERIYWWCLNTLWWLEGEALSAAVVSGVCYALRRRVLFETPHAEGADDILFALAAGAHGHGVRLCRGAGAIETRVPHTLTEFVSFRRRRGAGYFGALRAPLPATGSPGGASRAPCACSISSRHPSPSPPWRCSVWPSSRRRTGTGPCSRPPRSSSPWPRHCMDRARSPPSAPAARNSAPPPSA
jgi:cellulose synthase/poly-beta-1,6-N-acetylglucosamine synthase-like glycosyltransferase